VHAADGLGPCRKPVITCCHFLIVEVAEVEGYPRGRGLSIISQSELFLQIVMFAESKSSSFLVHAFAGGIIALWKSVGITVKVEIGGGGD
jgi:hypothetical protein